MTPNQPGADGIEEVESLDAEDEPIDDASITVVVADDHPMWRDAVARDLAEAGFEVVAHGRRRARRRSAGSRRPAPTSLVLDLNLPGVHGRRGVRASSPPRTCRPGSWCSRPAASSQDVLDAVKAGATGYLVKSAAREEFLDAVRRTARGRRGVHARAGRAGAGGVPAAGDERRLRRPPRAPQLTERETEVLRLVAKGLSLQADRRAAGALAPHRAEPRAEHPRQAPAAQPRRAGPLRDLQGPAPRLSAVRPGYSEPRAASTRPAR